MKNVRYYIVGLIFAVSSAVSLAGCGTTSGAIIGGATGYALGGDAPSTVGGAVAGGIIGHSRENR